MLNRRIGLGLAIILVATLSFYATALAGGGGSIVTFDNPDKPSSDFAYEEDGILVQSGPGFEILDIEPDGDLEVKVSVDESIDIMRLDNEPFELTSFVLESNLDEVEVTADHIDSPFLTSAVGTVLLNWSGVTKVTIKGFDSIFVVDNIVIDGGGNGGPGGGGGGVNGGGGSHGGNKADKVEICHLNEDGNMKTININGNALDAHLAHGDSEGACS